MTTLVIASNSGQNYELACDIDELIKKQNIQSEVLNLEDYPMPIYTTTLEKKDGIPKEAHELFQKIKNAQRLIFCFPEYNGNVPPTLNNSIAWVSRIGSDWREAFNDKLGMLATNSWGPGLRALIAGRSMLEYLGMFIYPRMIQVYDGHPFNPTSVHNILNSFYSFKK